MVAMLKTCLNVVTSMMAFKIVLLFDLVCVQSLF
jgi:hypothetical protein